jgi:hypothetical protein
MIGLTNSDEPIYHLQKAHAIDTFGASRLQLSRSAHFLSPLYGREANVSDRVRTLGFGASAAAHLTCPASIPLLTHRSFSNPAIGSRSIAAQRVWPSTLRAAPSSAHGDAPRFASIQFSRDRAYTLAIDFTHRMSQSGSQYSCSFAGCVVRRARIDDHCRTCQPPSEPVHVHKNIKHDNT